MRKSSRSFCWFLLDFRRIFRSLPE